MKHWNIRQPDITRQKILTDSLGVSPVTAQLLINRKLSGLDQAKTFLSGTISELYNPFLMEGMHEAVSRIKKAIENKEKILIHGDYDVDGVTSIALLIYTFRSFGVDVSYYIPDRLTEGYGLSKGGVEEAIKIGATLVITVDCGISSNEEVDSLRNKNIDVIITDHHEVPDIPPQAYAIVNPRMKNCAYPDKNLAGVGIAFKLAEALCSILKSSEVWRHFDLVSLGTVADIVPLTGENRIIVKEGMKLLNNGTHKVGLKALIEASGLKDKPLGSFAISYILGPRINAAGRLGAVDLAVRLLVTEDEKEAGILAKALNEKNRERQKIESSFLKQAVAKVGEEVDLKEHKVIVLHNEDWHPGVMGIVASRIADRFFRPCILISMKDGIGRGSGRSVENFHLFDALTGCEDILEEYGGHKYACGLTILEGNIEQFKNRVNEKADSVVDVEKLSISLNVDMELGFSSLDHKVLEELYNLEPFGQGNPTPLLCSRNLRLIQPPRVIKGSHLKFWVTDGSKNIEAIGFGLAKDSEISKIVEGSPEIDLVYSASLNTWRGLNSIQLKIVDIKPSVSSQP